MTLDIIIPALNESKNLEVLIPYLKAQLVNTSSNIFVVDADSSEDNSADICRRYDVNYSKSPLSQRSHQMNLGAMTSSADVIMFLHADVRPPKNFYTLIKKELDSGAKAGMFAYRFDRESRLLRINASFTKYDGIFAGGGDQCLFIKKNVFNELGQFNDEFVIMEDFDLFSRLKKNKISYSIIPNQAIVSARKYKENSYLRVNIANLIAFINFKCNVTPSRIKDSYHRWLN